MQFFSFTTRSLSVYVMTIVCLIFFLFSCATREDNAMKEQLMKIQTLGDSLPEEAIKAYKEILPEKIEECSRYTQIRHQLLGVKLRYKAGFPPTSPDSIISICSYMEKHGSDEDKIESYYYMGTVYWELNDYPQAVENCLKASQLIEAGVPGNKIIGRTICNTYSLLAYLYTELRIYKDALKAAKKEYDYAKQYQILDPNIICYLAATYKANNKYTEATEYYNQAVDMIEHEGSLIKYADVLANALHFYSMSKNKKSAERTLAILSKVPESEKPYNYIGALSDYAVEFNIAGLIETTLLEVIKDEVNSTDVTQALYNLTRYYYDRGDYKRSAEYAMKLREKEESTLIERAQEQSMIAHGNQIYNQNKDGQIKLLQESESKKKLYLYAAIIFFVIAVGLGYLYQRKYKQLSVKIESQMREIQSAQETLEQKGEYINRISKEFDKANKELAEKSKQLEIANKQLEEQQTEIKKEIQYNESLLENMLKLQSKKQLSELYDEFTNLAKKNHPPTEEQWQELYIKIEKEFPGFRKKLESSEFRMTDVVLQTCYLVKLGVSKQHIMILTKSPRQSVSNRYKRISEKLIGLV